MTDPVAIINSSLDAPAVVATVRVHGLRLVKDDVLQPHLRAAMTATTLGGVLRGLSDASERIQRLDVFHDFDVRVGEPRDDLAPENALDVDIYVREKGRLKAETGTSVGMGTGEGSLRLSAGVRHVFGRAERLDVQAAAGTSANASFALTFTKPVEADPDRPLELSLFHQQNDWKLPSGYEEKAVGLLAKYRAPSLLGVHVVSYEASWRELTHLSRYVSWAVREEAGHSLKSALRHELLHNRSDSLVMPTQGYQVRLTQELAGIGGDVNYLKHDLHTKAAVRLGWGISTSLGLQFGVMAPLADTPTRINDRFFLGGPVSLRGFRLRAAGPSAPRHMDHKPPAGHTHDALGGELYWAAGLSVFAPVPVPTLWNQSLLRLHGFVNAGNLARLHRDTPWQQGLQAVAGTADVTAGAGIVLNIQGARVELNYCFPLHGPHADRKDRGGQLGVGLSFL